MGEKLPLLTGGGLMLPVDGCTGPVPYHTWRGSAIQQGDLGV